MENLGIWSKIKNDFSANRERIDYWIKKGAQVSPSLKKLLEKGEAVRIKDYKAMLKAIRTQQGEGNRNLFNLLDDFDLVRNRVNDQWQKIVSINYQ